ncbi:MAG TPA: serine hydrolase domain-containing protein [Ignavibacteria bacterium]|nr:serine hydrolase domain-containing protein [Ignavibacteria bacterium]
MKNIHTAFFALFLCIIFNQYELKAQDVPSNTNIPGIENFDNEFISFMEKWEVPGGQVTVCKDGRLVYSKAYGYSDLENKIPATTDELFRIASVSKPITAVAIMKMIQEGKLKLSDKALDILSDFTPPPGTTVIDKRWYDITVENLLEHTGGWTLVNGDRQIIYLRKAADAFGTPRPADAKTIIRYGMKDSLEFTPGTEYSYSNFGYNILGRIIEKISGKTYEKYMQEEILALAGISDMLIAKTRDIYRLPNEAKYYTENDNKDVFWSVLDEEEKMVTMAYGADYFIEVMDSHGGWLSTAEDLAKFVTSVDTKTNRPHILTQATVDNMLSEPTLKPKADATQYYAKGWNYEPSTDSWFHAGALAGVTSYIIRMGDGTTVTVIFNFLSMSKLGDYLTELTKSTVPNSLKSVKQWPAEDLFNIK